MSGLLVLRCDKRATLLGSCEGGCAVVPEARVVMSANSEQTGWGLAQRLSLRNNAEQCLDSDSFRVPLSRGRAKSEAQIDYEAGELSVWSVCACVELG